MRKINFAEGEYYHIYNRGVDKRSIFSDERDYERFIICLFLSNSNKYFGISKNKRSEDWSFGNSILKERGESIVAIGVYSLMPNHFHLLVKEIAPGGISKFMQKLQAGYTLYFNKKHHRTGALFESTFKAEHVDSDRYLKYLYSYIHLNSVGIIDKGWRKKQIENISEARKFVKGFRYSSYRDYMGEERLENIIINKDAFPNYFETIQEFEQMMDFWIDNSEESFIH